MRVLTASFWVIFFGDKSRGICCEPPKYFFVVALALIFKSQIKLMIIIIKSTDSPPVGSMLKYMKY